MRAPVPSSSWLKLTSLLLVAPTSFTGTWTSPKLIAPVQIELGIGSHSTYGGPERGRAHQRRRRRPRAVALQPRQAALPRRRVPQGRRGRLLPPDRTGDAPAPGRPAPDPRTRPRRRAGRAVLREALSPAPSQLGPGVGAARAERR